VVLELLRFLAGASIIAVPGILFALGLRMGRDWLETSIHGSCLGLAGAVYLATLISHFDLRWFYPVWAAIGLSLLVFLLKTRPTGPIDKADRSIRQWMILILLIVAASRYAIALPQVLPQGWDPTFHTILARKIQLTSQAISDWTPFESIPLNYPTGAHTLVAVLSTICGLDVHVTFKDLIPLLGVLATGQIFLLVRCVTGNATAALFGAMAYGMWADYGSIDYYYWGGLPNQLAMLLFLSMLLSWLEPWPTRTRLPVMSVFYAAAVLSHHHVMLTSAAILAVTLLYPGAVERRLLLSAGLATAALDSFFLIPYAAKITLLRSTHVLHSGEPRIALLYMIQSIGWVFLLAALSGIVLTLLRRSRTVVHPVVPAALLALAVLYAFCEYGWPLLNGSTILTPSRFPTDASSFLAVFAGLSVAYAQQQLHASRALVVGLMLLMSGSLAPRWLSEYRGSGVSSDYLAACHWISQNTAPSAFVIIDKKTGDIGNQLSWIPYLTWRRTVYTPLPDSEPLDSLPSLSDRADRLMSGNGPPDCPPDCQVVAILSPDNPADLPVLWRGPSGLRVVRIWPH
jgi:hypothetical protein